MTEFTSRRDTQTARYDLIPVEALEAMAITFAHGDAKYGRCDRDAEKPNWADHDLASHQNPLSHAQKHLAMHGSGDMSEDHLAHAMANIGMLIWFRDNPESPFVGMTPPEILGHDYMATAVIADERTEDIEEEVGAIEKVKQLFFGADESTDDPER